MKKKRPYDVEVTHKVDNKIGFKLRLNACGISFAEADALDILARKSCREVYGSTSDDPVGYDIASRMFKIKARVSATA